jgi:hypothetical protein
MSRRSKAIAMGFALIIGAGSILPAYAGSFVDDVWGVVTDPLKLSTASSTLSDSLSRTLAQLAPLEGKANYDVQARLEQIRSIIREALAGGDAAIDKAILQMKQLEAQINADAIQLIYRSQCLAVNVDAEIQKTVADLVDKLIKANFQGVIAHIPIASLKASPIVIQQPDVVYRSARAEALNVLDKNVTDETPAYEIYWTYQNLELMAKWTMCRYLDQAGAESFTMEMNEFERLSRPWDRAIDLKKF